MANCTAVSLFLCLFLIISFIGTPKAHAMDTAQAQNTGQHPFPFFIAPTAEAVYSRTSPAFGGGIAFGGGDFITLGAKAVYFVDREAFYSLEAGMFVRVFFFYFRLNDTRGPFIQLNYGFVVFAHNEAVSTPAEAGTISAGLSAGWRFLLGNRFFIEPAVRAGYPYFAGAGLSAGFRL
jgi:hypothetical protein